MSSRILRGEAHDRVEPIHWKTWSTQRIDAPPVLEVQERQPPAIDPQALERARSEGHAAGEAAARAALAGQVQAKCAEFDRALAAIASHKDRLRHEAESDVVQLAIAIARRILAREIQIDPEVLLGLVKAAVEKLNARELVEIRLASPLGDVVHRLALPRGVNVSVDPALEPGGVIIATSRGEVDASVSSQLEEIGRGLTSLLVSGRPL